MFIMGQTFKSNLNGLRTTFQVALHLKSGMSNSKRYNISLWKEHATEIQQAIVRIQQVLR